MVRKIILRRLRAEERSGNDVHLWFSNSDMSIIVSLLGAEGDIRTRISTPTGDKQIAHPFADVHWTKYKKDDFGDMKRYKEGIVKHLKAMGYDVEVRG